MLEVILGFIIPFAGTTLGAFMVFFMKSSMNERLEKSLLGFAAGIMTAASIWSLLIPSIETSAHLKELAWLPAMIGLITGFVILFLMDKLLQKSNKTKNNALTIFAITVHNIPEGMAVGVALAGAYFGNSLLSLTGALALAIGIGVQNFPEGAIVSMPLKAAGMNKPKAFLYGALSGIVEPIFACISFFIAGFVSGILPYVLSFAAGSMLYVVIHELIPSSQSNNRKFIETFGFLLGFIIMMILDITLG